MKEDVDVTDIRIFSVLTMNSNFSEFIRVECSVSPYVCTFLLDTQAEVSVIKVSSLHKAIPYDRYDFIDIRGITDQLIRSLGAIHCEFFFNGVILPQHLYIVPDTFNMPSDGILGKNFLKTYQCDFSFRTSTLTMYTARGPISTNIYEGPNDNSLVIPPRCEMIRKFNVKFSSRQAIRYVPSQQLAIDVFAANTIVDADEAYVRIINVSDCSRVIDRNKIVSHSIDNYAIYKFDETKGERDKKLIEILTKDVPGYAKEKFSDLCAKYTDVFALPEDRMTVNNFYTQHIRLKDKEPVYSKQYRLPHVHKEEINRQVKQFMDNGLIEHSTSCYNSPVLIVPKKQKGKWRMCVDYRQVNKKVIQDRFPLPRIDDILDSLGRARFFSVLDLFQGFHQVPLDEESKDVTSFSTDKGTFRWKVLPFGLNIAPNSFTRMMSIAFSGLSPMQCFVYMDDLIVLGTSEQTHLENLEAVFTSCRKYNLKLNPYKCSFFRPEVTYIGHKCTKDGVLPDDTKIDSVRNYPRPHDKDSAKRFVAFANFYRKFIHHFATTAKPLNALTRRRSKFEWTERCEHAFETLKKALISPPILQYPDFNKPFIITVDASMHGTGGILSQMHDDDDLPVSYASKCFTQGESNKPTIEQELIAIHFAIKHYRPYVYGTQFIVKSDHRPLVYLFGLKDPSSKLTRIRLELEEYDFFVEHIKGKDNVGADALSRMHISDFKKLNDNTKDVLVMTRSMTKKMDYEDKNDNVVDRKDDSKVDLRVYEELGFFDYNKVPRLKVLRDFDESSLRIMFVKKRKLLFKVDLAPRDFSEASLRRIFSMLDDQAEAHNLNKAHITQNDLMFDYFSMAKFKEVGNEVLKNIRVILTTPVVKVLDEEGQLAIMKKFHEDPMLGGHCGQRRLYAKIRSRYFWKQMSNSIRTFVRNCHKCQINKTYVKTKEELEITPTPQTAFDIVTIDTIGPLPKTDDGNRYAVTLICNLTKYLVTAATPDKESKTIAKAIFNSFISIYGPMQSVLTDRGTEYKNQTLEEMCKMLNIELRHSTAHHHETVGTIERNHRTLNEYLRSYIDMNLSNWDDFIRKFTYCYNITPNVSLGLKYTPFELVFGKKPLCFDVLKRKLIEPIYNMDDYAKELKYRLQIACSVANGLLKMAKSKYKEYYDDNLNKLQVKVNDKILITNEDRHKLEKLYLGPFTVTKVFDKNVEFIDEAKGKISIVHKNRVKKYNG